MTKPNLTEIVLIVDDSGSMNHLKQETARGVNNFLSQQRELKGECFVSIISFNTHVTQLRERCSVKDCPEIMLGELHTEGSTALYDAMGQATVKLGAELSALPESERPSKVIIVTMTDGAENASVEYSYDTVEPPKASSVQSQGVVYINCFTQPKWYPAVPHCVPAAKKSLRQLIEQQQSVYAWTYIFLGANIDAQAVASFIGIKPEMAHQYWSDAKGTRGAYNAVNYCCAVLRSGESIDNSAVEKHLSSK